MAHGDFFEVSGLGRGSNGRQEPRKEMNKRAGVKRIKPRIPFIKENYFGFRPSDPHR
jgi:hypothetical protein